MTSFYDQIKEHSYTPQERKNLETIGLRNFNNAQKSFLIQKFVKKGDYVLDLGAGKGGDLWKWQKAGISAVFLVDQSRPSLDEAQRRYQEIQENCDYFAHFIHGNFCDPALYDDFLNEIFHVVSCQFAIHYAFFPGSNQQCPEAHTLLKNVSRLLKPQGYFICTFPVEAQIKKYKNNALCQISLRTESYMFQLRGAVRDSKEFYVDPLKLAQIAATYGMNVVYYEEFSEIQDKENEISVEERSIANLYAMCAFKKFI